MKSSRVKTELLENFFVDRVSVNGCGSGAGSSAVSATLAHTGRSGSAGVGAGGVERSLAVDGRRRAPGDGGRGRGRGVAAGRRGSRRRRGADVFYSNSSGT
jgi:hypothetical protein